MPSKTFHKDSGPQEVDKTTTVSTARNRDDASVSSPSYTTASRRTTPRNRGELDENCALCNKKITVTNRTRSAKLGPGFLCISCAKPSIPPTDLVSLSKGKASSSTRTGPSKSNDVPMAEISFIEVSDEGDDESLISGSSLNSMVHDQKRRRLEHDESIDVEEGRASVKKTKTIKVDTLRLSNSAATAINVDELTTGTFVSDGTFSGDSKTVKLEGGKEELKAVGAESPSTQGQERIQRKQPKELETELKILEEKNTKLQTSLKKSEQSVARLTEKKKFLTEAVELSRKTYSLSQAKRASLEEEVRQLKKDAENLTSELDQSKQENTRLQKALRLATLQTASSEQTNDQAANQPLVAAEYAKPQKLCDNTQPQHLISPTDTVTYTQDQTLNNQGTDAEGLEASYSATRPVGNLWVHLRPTSDRKLVTTSIESILSGLNGLKERVFEDDNTISKLTDDLEALNAAKAEHDNQLKQLSTERDKAIEEAASSRQQYTALRQTLINLGNG